MRSFEGDPLVDAASGCRAPRADQAFDFGWRALLRHVRALQGDLGASGARSPSERMAAMEAGRIAFDVRAPRTSHGDFVWRMLRERLARHRMAAVATQPPVASPHVRQADGSAYARSA